MSLPPATVKIKRKRTDEPVDFLRVHEANGKRQRRATDFVFSRQQTLDIGNDSETSQPAPQGVRRIKQIHRSTSSQSLGARNNPPTSQSQSSQIQNVADSGVLAAVVGQATQTVVPPVNIENPETTAPSNGALQVHASQPRRFHISRAPTDLLGSVPGGQGQSRKRKDLPTVFVERRVRPRSSDGPKSSQLSGQGLTPEMFEIGPGRPQKKPGLNARSPVPRSRDSSPPKPSRLATPTERKVRLPSGLVMPWDVTSEQLAAEMQAYTLQEIGYNLAESEATKPGPREPTTPSDKRGPTKFKPKKPALRYAERHPGGNVSNGSEMNVDEEFLDEDMDSDGDYIIDTYIRMPAEALEATEMQKNIGLLILDSQPDIDEFYREDEDSDEEEEDEEEDENAENHYTADYPDEEVDSDDEYGRNAYNYRTHNASDLEEFDEDDATFSDDENESTKYPWAKRPWMKRPEGRTIDDIEDK